MSVIKKIPNVFYILLGTIGIASVFVFDINGILGFLLVWLGILSTAYGVLRGGNVLRKLVEFFS